MEGQQAGNSQALEVVQKVNALLSAAVPTVGLAMGAITLVRELFRRRQAGEPELSLDEMAQRLIDGGGAMIDKADAWFAEHGYAPDGTKLPTPDSPSGQ